MRGFLDVARSWLVAAALLGPALAAWSQPPPGAGRERVLKQVRVPHHYYYREMYLPQAASGPSAPAWSPDGRELAVSIEGALYRVDPATGAARQLTDGPGYDYQPDWSPDGRFLAYASYRDDALELWLLELESGRASPLTANGAANRRYLEFLGTLDDPTAGVKRLEKIAERVHDQGRSHRGFNLFDGDDLDLFQAISRGQFTISGFRNRDLRKWLPGRSAAQLG